MKTLLVVLVLAIAAPASAAWQRVDSPNFILVGDVSARDLRGIAARFEAFHETLRRVLPAAATREPVPTVVIVFPSDAAFTPFKPVYRGRTRTAVAGYATAGLDVNYIAMVDVAASDRLIFHEYTHMVVANAVAKAPVWLNEGLAEFYSTFAVADGGRRVEIGRPVPEHLRLLHGALPVPLAELLRVETTSPLYNENERVSEFYAESWALTHMLLSEKPGRAPELGDYLRRVAGGTTEVEAWEQVFGTERTENELRRYLQRTTFASTQVDFTEKLTPLSTADRPLSAADAASFLSALQLRNAGADAAARVLEPVLKTEPTNVLANIVMAEIENARRDAPAAERRLLGLARSDDWFASYGAGVALMRMADLERGFDGLGAALTRAAELLDGVGPEHADLPNVLATLAKIELLADRPLSPGTLARIARARALAPGRIDYALTHAELYANAGDFKSARGIVGPLMTAAYPESVRSSARELMTGLVDLERAAAK